MGLGFFKTKKARLASDLLFSMLNPTEIIFLIYFACVKLLIKSTSSCL